MKRATYEWAVRYAGCEDGFSDTAEGARDAVDWYLYQREKGEASLAVWVCDANGAELCAAAVCDESGVATFPEHFSDSSHRVPQRFHARLDYYYQRRSQS